MSQCPPPPGLQIPQLQYPLRLTGCLLAVDHQGVCEYGVAGGDMSRAELTVYVEGLPFVREARA